MVQNVVFCQIECPGIYQSDPFIVVAWNEKFLRNHFKNFSEKKKEEKLHEKYKILRGKLPILLI